MGTAISEACGGQLIIGFDDAGNYHTADGSVLVYGSVCATWDASAYTVDGGLNCDTSNANSTAICTQATVPPSLATYFNSYCVGTTDASTAGQCSIPHFTTASSGHPEVWYPPCASTDDAGDAFCEAFYDQFVSHGHVLAQCRSAGGAPQCVAWGDSNGQPCGIDGFPVPLQDADGGISCVPFCTPP
jgi:hypothetical protein